MRNLLAKFNSYSIDYVKKILSISLKKRFICNIIAILFACFFISAPIALIVNLFLFEQYFNLVSLAVAITGFGGFFIYNCIIYSIYNKIIPDFKYKYILIVKLFICIIGALITYLLLILVIKRFI